MGARGFYRSNHVRRRAEAIESWPRPVGLLSFGSGGHRSTVGGSHAVLSIRRVMIAARPFGRKGKNHSALLLNGSFVSSKNLVRQNGGSKSERPPLPWRREHASRNRQHCCPDQRQRHLRDH